MIFFHILIFFLSIILFSASISGYGRLIKLRLENNFFLDIFLGLVVISFIVTIIHFFFKIDLIISFFIFSSGLILFFKRKNSYFSRFFLKKNIFYLTIILLFIPMFISQKYHEDFGYYHLPYALGFIEEKIVFGYANIGKSYVYNSVWLNLYSIFFLYDKNFDFLTLPSFLLFLSFILFSLHNVNTKKNILTSDWYLIIILFYLILKFTRISEFGVDFPATIFSMLGIYYFIKFFETNLIEEKKTYFFLIVIFSIYSILIKLSTLPIILLSFYIYFKFLKNSNFSIKSFRYFFILLLFLSFFLQQFIYTGCFVFPSNLTCFNVSWFNYEYLNLSKEIELINKNYNNELKKNFSPEQYLNNFNWLHFWIKRNFIEISEHLTTIIIPSLIFVSFLKRKNQLDIIFKEKVAVYIFLLVGLLFWLNFSPVYRFAIHLFATLVFIILLNVFLSKKFSKKIFTIFVVIFIFFSFFKNIIRLNNVDNIFIGIQKINNSYVFNKSDSNEFAKIFHPDVENNSNNGWQGRLCWNTPFICSYNKINVNKKNGYLILNKLNN